MIRGVPTTLLLAGIVASATCACGRRTVSDPAEWSIDVRPLAVPAQVGSREPQLTGSGPDVVLSWLEHAGATNTLKFSQRTGSGWSAPMTVASGTDWFVSYADPPAVMRLSDGTLVAQWLQQTDPRIEAMDLRLSYSTDDGKTWARPFTPHHDGTVTQHAFASLFELPGRSLGLVWLDGRESFIETDDPAGGAMTMRAAAFDSAWVQTADTAVDRRVCECCSTSVAATANGVIAAYRDRLAGEIRDVAVSRFENGAWSEAISVHKDDWKTYSCPVNGPAVSARGNQVVTSWFTAVNDEGRAFVAFSSDAGRSWGSPIRLDDGVALGRVDVELLDEGSAVATWIEFADGKSQLRVRRVDSSGARSPAVALGGLGEGGAAGFPRMARQGDELLFAWTDSAESTEANPGATQVRTAVARLP